MSNIYCYEKKLNQMILIQSIVIQKSNRLKQKVLYQMKNLKQVAKSQSL